MRIEEGNANKTTKIDKRFSISIILALVIFMISGSAATMTYATPQTLPTCVDPTGHNLPCIMFISTLPPPMHTLQCQETSGQIFKCTYIVDKLSNGNQVVAITVYVATNNVVVSGEVKVVKVVVHTTTTRIGCPEGQILNHTTHKCVDIKPPVSPCHPGQHPALVNGIVKCVPPCERPDSDAKTDLDKNLKTADCDIGDANEHGITPPPPPCNSPNYNGTCLPTNNMTVAASVGKGTTCAAGNCTTGTPPPVDCKINPNDPSCTQTLQPLTPPTTKTCPDGSVIDTSASCPTQSTPPPPTNNNPPPTENNPTPPSGNDNGNNNPPSGGSGSSGGSSGGGSNPPSPSTLQ